MAKTAANSSNSPDNRREVYEVNLIRSQTASIPLIYPQSNTDKPIFECCNVFDFLEKIGEYGLVLFVSMDETKTEGKYNNCLYFRGDAGIKESFFDKEKKQDEFEQFMDISRTRIREAKNTDFSLQGHGSYGEYVSFAAYGVKEKVEWDGLKQSIERCYKKIHSKIKDIVVYEFPFTRIGRRSCGPLYLIFIDTSDVRMEKDERKRHLFCSSIQYRALAEINSNIWMKKRLEDLSFKERVKELEKEGTCDSYIRAVKKLAAMQRFENFGKMIRMLAEIQYFGKKEKTALQNGDQIKEESQAKKQNQNKNNVKKKHVEWYNYSPNMEDQKAFNKRLNEDIKKRIKEYYLATFEFTSENSNLFDTKMLDGQKVEIRKEMIHLMWKTSYYLSAVMELLDIYHGNTDSTGCKADSVDKQIDNIMSETMQLLDEVPKTVWKANNEVNDDLSTKKDGKLQLKGPVLALFLLTKYAEWRRKEAVSGDTLLGGSPKTANCEKLLFLKHLLHVIQYTLRISDDKDPEILRSVIWLISEFGHTALGINRHLDIEKNLFLLAQQQAALFGLKDYYRDHLNHVIQVCLTGWLLLETKFGVQQLYYSFPTLKGTDATSSAADNNNPAWLKNILAKWFVASLLHDVGYILSIGDGWMKLLGSFRTKSLLSVQQDMKESLNRSINWRLEGRSKGFLSNEPDYEDHGVIGALHLSELIHSINPKEYEEYVCAFRAVAFHSKSEEDLVFDDDPLAVLLVICDEIQEWGRPSVDRNHLSLNLATNSPREEECWYDSIESLGVNIETKYEEKTKLLHLSLVDNVPLTCTIKYKENIHKNNSIFKVWLGRSESLQRLKLRNSHLMNLSFIIKSAIRENNQVHPFRKNETHMERLKRFVRETHYWKLFRWLECVKYDGKNSNDEEIVTLDIDKLYEKKPIEGEMEEFWKAFLAWKDAGDAL